MTFQLHSLPFPRAAARLRFIPVGAVLLAPTVVFAAAPVINLSAPEQHYYYAPEETGGTQFGFVIPASNSPTSFDAIGLPANASINRTAGTISGALNVPGVFPLTLSATNADGTGTAALKLVIHPGIIGVTTSRGDFTAGQSFTISVTCNRPLIVTGTPAISFLMGTATRSASYVSGSGSSTIVFKYTVVGGDSSNGQEIQLRALETTSGALRDADGLEPSPQLPLRYFSSGIKVSAPGAIAPTPAVTSTPPTSVTTPAPLVASTAAGPRLVNLSSRVNVREGDASRAFIAGFVVSGASQKQVLVRAVGPTLATFGLQSALTNPRLRIVDTSGRIVAENDDWSGADTAAAFARLGAFGLAPGSRDAALLVSLPAGAYSLQVVANGGDGVVLAEIYDASEGTAEADGLINLSTRAYVDTGESVLTAGFVVTGSASKRVLIRGVGPALSTFGVAGALRDPVLKVFTGTTLVAQNDDWQTPQAVSAAQAAASAADIAAAAGTAGAFPLTGGSKDAAVVLSLPPGAYTAVVSGANNATGAGLIEVYELAVPRP